MRRLIAREGMEGLGIGWDSLAGSAEGSGPAHWRIRRIFQ